MPVADRVIVELEARLDRYERDVRRAEQHFTRSMGTIDQSATRTSSLVSRSMGIIGAAAAGVSLVALARGFLAIADEAKKLDAQLRLATATFGTFGKAQDDVRRIAAITLSDLTATGALYANFARSARELGISQADVARATETVAKTFKISGAGAVEAAQATRQLVQGLQSGTLRGDEFNSVMEAAPRLSQLLADSLNVPKGALRAMAEAGELTSAALTRALTDTKFTESLDAEFKQIPVTFDEAMGQVRNAALITFGAFDRGGQFSTALANFITGGTEGFADLEKAAENAGIDIRASLSGITEAFSPLTAAIRETIDLYNRLREAAGGGDAQGEKSFLYGSAQDIRRWAPNSIAGRAATRYIEGSDRKRAVLEGRAAGQRFRDNLPQGWDFSQPGAMEAFISGRPAAGPPRAAPAGKADAERKPAGRQSRETDLSADQVGALLKARFGGTVTATTGGKHVAGSDHYVNRAVDFVPRGGVGATNKDEIRAYLASQGIEVRRNQRGTEQLFGPGDRGHSKHFHVAFERRRRTPEQLADSAEADAARAERDRLAGIRDDANKQADLARLADDLLAARAALATAASTVLDFELQGLESARTQRIADLRTQAKLGELSTAEVAERERLVNATADLQKQLAQRRAAEAEAARQAARLLDQADTLEAEAQLVRSRQERVDIERRILALRQQEERAALEAAIAAGDIADAAEARANLERRQSAARQGVERGGQSPLTAYADRLNRTPGELSDEVETLVVDQLEAVQDGIASAISRAIGTKDPLINGLINLLVEQVLMRPLAAALSRTAAGGAGGGGILGSVIGAATSLLGFGGGIGGGVGANSLGGGLAGFRASGGHVSAGHLYRVNEGGIEGFQPAGSGKIIPLGRMNRADGGAIHLHQNVTVNAQGSVNPDGYAEHIKSAVREETLGIVSHAVGLQQKSMPRRMVQFDADGT